VAVQNKVDPASRVIAAEEERMLTASNTVSSENDDDLVRGIIGNPNAIGYFGYAYYQANTDVLKVVTIDGIAPSAETAESGEYPLARPLYIYSSADIIQAKPQIGAFINFYLSNVNEIIGDVGYFPISNETLDTSRQAWLQASGAEGSQLPAIDVAGLPQEPITVSGSSTVYPLTRQMALLFRRADFGGSLNLDQTGSSAGFRLFCDGQIDIADASRAITRAEVEACQKKRITPLEFRVGTDALAFTPLRRWGWRRLRCGEGALLPRRRS
jgi:ABC-type phosphate transport system substrate-binding protein